MPSIPINIVTNKQFRRFAYRFDKRYKIPKSAQGGTAVLARQVKCVKRNVKQRIGAATSKVTVVVDIWSAYDSSYVGVNSHFVDSKGCLAVCFLGVRDVEGTKTAERVRKVVDSVLAEYEISEEDVGFFITDNGSNLLKAYRESIEEVRIHVPDDNAEADNEDSDSDVEEAPARRKVVVQHVDPNVEETDVEDELEDNQAGRLITEHEALETQFDASFPKRISCFDHCLELVLKKAIDDINKTASRHMRRARAILRKAKNSAAAKRALRRRTGRLTYILPATTRWGSHYLMAERIVLIWQDLNQVWTSKGWPTFLESQITYLRKFCELIEPFYAELMAKQRDSSVTSSHVYGAVKKLLRHCDKFRNDAADIANLAIALKSELVKRFGCFINVNIPSFKPHYVLAAILDPSQAFLVDVDAEYISRLIAERIGNDVGSETQSDAEAGPPDDDASYEELMRKKRKLEKRSSSQTQPAGLDNRSLVEAKEYLNSVLYQDFGSTDPLEWWRSEGYVKFPNVHSLALNYLAAPATSASIERTFSHGGLAVRGSKNRTQEELLNMKLMYHLNENISS
ncbi:hypothetical protein AAVH_10346 [Aphelenchoides avenae]|nr:hypothetical protein AAVH_10346 [Aphelenchus avenae]